MCVGDFPSFFFLVRSEVERETGLFFNRDWLKEEEVGVGEDARGKSGTLLRG